MKKGVFFVVIAIGVMLFHGWLLMKVSEGEIAVRNTRKELEELEKEVEKKEMEYDNVADLERIGNEMRSKKNMVISKEIKFFQINN